MVCGTCGSTGKKMVKCTVLGEICMRCCFSIASGSPQLIEKIKKEKNLSKSDILKVCAECNQEIQK